MTLNTFFEKFELFADAPDAVAKMRELVLDWAASGKLCHSDSVEWKEGVLGDVIELISGQHLLAHEQNEDRRGIPYLTGPSDFGEKNPIPARWTDQPKVTAEPGDILITVKGSGVGKTNVLVDQPTAISRQLMAIRVTGADPEFVHVVLKRAAEHFQNAKTGIAIPGIGRREVLGLKVVLPPLAEQKRIVAKVDELMALCDRLALQQQERESRHAALARASLARFADAPTPANLKYLFHSSFNIHPSSLRRSILTLAVQGKLVPQDPNDEPAEELLARIARKRTELLKAAYPNRDEASTQLRKQEAQMLPDGLESLAPGWSWATLIQASLLVVDCHNKTAPYVQSGTRLLRTTNIRDGRLNLSEPKFVDDATYERWSARCKPEPGDVLITREAPMGEVCIIPEGMKVCLGQRMMLIRLVPGTMDQKYLLYSLMAPDLMERVQDKPVGATVQHLRVGGVETLLTPIPPHAEQRRIVAKVEQLMALVDALETQLAASRATAANLLSALVAELT